MSSIPTGRRLGIDVGTVRVGLALSDSIGMLATPLKTVEVSKAKEEIINLIAQEDVVAIYVGWPLHLSGVPGSSSAMVRNFLGELSKEVLLPIRLIDERLSSTQATKYVGTKGDIDAIAATLILERALNEEASQGTLAGEPYEKI